MKNRVPIKVIRDISNRLKFGRDAPLSDECLFFSPFEIEYNYVVKETPDAPRFPREDSGKVVDGDWDKSVAPVFDDPLKLNACIEHFVHGKSWEETGILQALCERIDRDGHADGWRTREELVARYASLDRLFEEVKKTGRLATMRELPDYFRREHGGIMVHIARDGSPIRAASGKHRLAIARILELDVIPVQVGVVHLEAVTNGLLRKRRMPLLADQFRTNRFPLATNLKGPT